MARLDELDLRGAENGSRAGMARRERRRRTERVDGGERALDRLEACGVLADECRELRAHPALLRFLVLRGEEEPVVQLDGEERLDEDRLAGLRAILDHAGDRVR